MNFDFDKMYCGSIHRGDVVIVEQNKKEIPILILQDDVLNNGFLTVIGALIELHKKNEEILINELLLGSSQTGLGKDGVCKLYKIITVGRENIIAKKGEIDKLTLEKVFEKLDITLGRFREK